MKTYEDMARDVLQRIDAYEAGQKTKRARITKAVVSAAPVCAAAVIGVGLWKGGVLTVNHDQLISSTTEAANSEVMLSGENVTSADKHSATAKYITDRNGESSASSVAAVPVRVTVNLPSARSPIVAETFVAIPSEETTDFANLSKPESSMVFAAALS